MIHIILRMGMTGVTTKEVMGAFNLNYKAAYWHLTNAKDKGLMRLDNIAEQKQYVTTDEGKAKYNELIASIEEPDETVAEIPRHYQLSALGVLSPGVEELMETDKEAAVKWLNDNTDTIATVTVYTAIAYGDLSQLEKLPKE